MNTLYKLSRQYANGELTKAQYREMRRKLINEALSGIHFEQNIITNVPVSEERKIADLDVTKLNGTSLIKQDNQKIVKTNYRLLFVLLLVVAIFFLTPQIALFINHYKSRVNDAVGDKNPVESINRSRQVDLLFKCWDEILVNHEITDKDIKKINELWMNSSDIDKKKFEEELKLKLHQWEKDFDKELEVSLSYQGSVQESVSFQ